MFRIFTGIRKKEGFLLKKCSKKALLKTGKSPMRKKDGTPIWASVTANVQYDEDGTIKWIDGVLEDITERKTFGRPAQACTEDGGSRNACRRNRP